MRELKQGSILLEFPFYQDPPAQQHLGHQSRCIGIVLYVWDSIWRFVCCFSHTIPAPPRISGATCVLLPSTDYEIENHQIYQDLESYGKSLARVTNMFSSQRTNRVVRVGRERGKQSGGINEHFQELPFVHIKKNKKLDRPIWYGLKACRAVLHTS